MKKFVSTVLCLFMLVTALPFAAFAQSKVIVEEAFSADNMPVSLQEIEFAANSREKFNLGSSIADFDIKIRLSDGSEHSLDRSNPLDKICSEEYIYYYYESYEEYLAAVEEAQNQLKEKYEENPAVCGSAYVKIEDFLKAKSEGLDEIKIYVSAELYEYNAETDKYALSESKEISFEKECVPYYYKLTPVSDLPDYFDRTTGFIDLSNTVFQIDCYDGTSKQAKVTRYPTAVEKTVYELDGELLDYRMYPSSKTVKITYFDCQYMWDVDVVKEFPPSEFQIDKCVFEGDALKEITYTAENAYGQPQGFRKQTTGQGEIIDMFEGNEVRVTQTKLSRFCSKVIIDIGGATRQTICAHEFDNIFMNFIAKIALIFQTLKNT